MNLEELRSIQSTERTRDSIQHLRESFYDEVADYIAELQRRRVDAANEAEDPFESDEVQRLSDEIRTVRNVTEAVYERRLGKLLTRASLAAVEDVATDEEGLTAEERALFRDVINRIEKNKSNVLAVIEGKADGDIPGVAESEGERSVSESTTDGDAHSDASSDNDDSIEGSRPTLNGAETETGGSDERNDRSSGNNRLGRQSGDEASRDEQAMTDQSKERSGGAAIGGTTSHEQRRGSEDDTALSDGSSHTSDTADPTAQSSVDSRTTVKITSDIDRFFGVDEREYDLEPDDVVTLPTANATPLLQSGTAERIE